MARWKRTALLMIGAYCLGGAAPAYGKIPPADVYFSQAESSSALTLDNMFASEGNPVPNTSDPLVDKLKDFVNLYHFGLAFNSYPGELFRAQKELQHILAQRGLTLTSPKLKEELEEKGYYFRERKSLAPDLQSETEYILGKTCPADIVSGKDRSFEIIRYETMAEDGSYPGAIDLSFMMRCDNLPEFYIEGDKAYIDMNVARANCKKIMDAGNGDEFLLIKAHAAALHTSPINIYLKLVETKAVEALERR